MSGAPRNSGGSRFLYDPFDAANARIEANERVLEERWDALSFRLKHLEGGLERLEKRPWVAGIGVAGKGPGPGGTDLVQ